MSNAYENYRKNIKSGDLLVWSERKASSLAEWTLYLVQTFTRSSYDHTGTAWVVGDRVLVVEATVPKVAISVLSTKENFYHLPMPIEWKPEYEEHLLSNVGKKYGFMNILKMSLGIGKTDPNEWFCSQMSADFYLKVGYITQDEIGYTPKDVVEGLMSKTGVGLVKVVTVKGD